MSHVTTTIDTLVDRYLEIWNETDPTRRRALIAATWAADATYRDPVLEGDGRDGIDAMTAGFQAAYPGHTFARHGEIILEGRTVQFGWALLGPDGTTQLTGSDDATLDAEGHVQSIVGTFDSPVPE